MATVEGHISRLMPLLLSSFDISIIHIFLILLLLSNFKFPQFQLTRYIHVLSLPKKEILISFYFENQLVIKTNQILRFLTVFLTKYFYPKNGV